MNNQITLTREEADALRQADKAIYDFDGENAEAFLKSNKVDTENYYNAIAKIKEQLESKEEPSYPISYLSKDDIRGAFRSNKKALKKIDKLDIADMEHLASKLGEAFSEYEDDLKILFEEYYL